MAPFAQERRQLQFGNIAHILLAHRVRLQKLQDDKFEWQRTLLNLGLRFDPKGSRVIIPEESKVKYHQVFQEIQNIQKEIDLVHAAMQAIQAETDFLQAPG